MGVVLRHSSEKVFGVSTAHLFLLVKSYSKLGSCLFLLLLCYSLLWLLCVKLIIG